MIKKVTIQLNQTLVCGGCAVVEKDGQQDTIFFDVVKSSPITVIVGSRGKQVSEEDADLYEKLLLELFIQHKVPRKLGIYRIPA